MDELHCSRTLNYETVPALGAREVQVFDFDQSNRQNLSDHQIKFLGALAKMNDGANAAHVGFPRAKAWAHCLPSEIGG